MLIEEAWPFSIIIIWISYLAIIFHVKEWCKIVHSWTQKLPTHPEMIKESRPFYPSGAVPNILLNDLPQFIFIFSHPSFDPFLPPRIIFIIENPWILLSHPFFGITHLFHINLVLVKLVSEDESVVVKPMKRFSCFNTCAQHLDTQPFLWHRVILVILCQKS